MTPFYTQEELKELGLKSFGSNVLISRKSSIYSPEQISIGDNVRIDDFCILSGNITIGSYVHIGVYSALFGKFGIELEDFAGLSIRTTILSATDDFSGNYLTNPLVDKSKTNVTGGKILLRKYSLIGVGSLIFPNITVGEGVAVGAMSVVDRSLEDWGIYMGTPARRIKDRSKEMLKLV